MILFGVLLLVGVVLFALFWGGSVVAQGTLYTEPADGLPWRSAAGAAAITVFLGVWCLLNWGAPDPTNLPYQNIFNFTASSTKQVPEFWSVLVDTQGNPAVDPQGKPIEPEHFTLHRQSDGRPVYTTDRDGKIAAWDRSGKEETFVAAIEIEDQPQGPRVRFSAPLETVGDRKQFKLTKVKSGMGQVTTNALQYMAPDGRYMSSNAIGNVTTDRFGLAIVNLLLNALHLALWFGVFWPLLRYQWGHAVGLAAVMWLLTSFAVLPMLFRWVPTAPPKAPPPVVSPEPTKSD